MSIMVYHAKREHFRNTSFYGYGDDIISAKQILAGLDDNSMYDYVATVDDIDDMDEAYRLTNNIDRPWSQNDEVTCVVPKVRSTSVGDLFVCKDGIYVVAPCGFDLLRKFKATS